MSRARIVSIFQILTVLVFFTSCCRSRDDVWDDTKTAGRHMSRGLRSLGGKHGDSRQICNRDQFYPPCEEFCYDDWQETAFEPLPDQSSYQEYSMSESMDRPGNAAPQSTIEPGDPRGPVPGINAFSDPKANPSLSRIFKNVTFAYNSSLIKGQDNLDTIKVVADYMKSHPNIYIFVEGHCDERGAEAYNLALGVRRSNIVRNLLIQEGVNPQNIFTVSYGKERPLDTGNNEASWAKNRRAEFKIYQQ